MPLCDGRESESALDLVFFKTADVLFRFCHTLGIAVSEVDGTCGSEPKATSKAEVTRLQAARR